MSDQIVQAKTSAGIPVIVDKIQNCQSAGFTIAVATGSRDEVPGIFGLSHLLEHTVFRATKTRDSYQMAKEMEGAGGELNAFTSMEMTAFYGMTIKETAPTAMEMVGDIVANPLINDEGTELEKKIVLQELSMIENEPESYIHDLFESHLWRGHQLSQTEGGDKETVARLTSKDLRAYYEEKYRIPNLAVYAAGNVDVDATVGWAERTLDGMSGGKRNIRTEPPTPKADYKFVESEADHLQVAMGFPKPGASHKDHMASALLAAILGSGTSSRLFQSVRESKALVYSIYSQICQQSDAGSIAIHMSCTDKNVEEAMRTTSFEIGRLLKDGLEKGELDRIKNLVKGSNVRAMESTSRRMYRLCKSNMLKGSVETLEESLAKIDAVTEDDVMRVARDLLRNETMNVMVLGKANKAIKSMSIDDLGF